jgi:hypothetical protein
VSECRTAEDGEAAVYIESSVLSRQVEENPNTSSTHGALFCISTHPSPPYVLTIRACILDNSPSFPFLPLYSPHTLPSLPSVSKAGLYDGLTNTS